MKVGVLGFALAAMVSAHATAGLIKEVEPNDTFDTAQDLSGNFPGAVAVEGNLSPGDIDWFMLDLTAGEYVTAAVFDFEFGANDSLLGVFRPGGELFAFDDDSGIGDLSAIDFFADEDGLWRLALTGGGDDKFIGAHEEEFTYKLVVNVIPAPGALACLGGLLAVRNRRRQG